MTTVPHSIVLGAGGYIGRHMILALQEAGHRVAGYDSPAVVNASPELGAWDITDAEAIPETVNSFDYLFMFAGLSGTAESFRRWREYIMVNEVGLLNILEHLSRLAHPPKLIFPSSRLVYAGQPGVRLKEGDAKEARTIYAATKLNSETLLDLYTKHAGLRRTVFRLCVPYGNRCSTAISYGTLRHFIGRAAAGQPISVYGDGSQRRSLIYIEDLCRIMASASVLPQTDNQTFNLGGPDGLSIGEIAETIASRYGVSVEHVPWPDDALRMESSDTVFDDALLGAVMPLDFRMRFADWVKQLD